MRGAKIRETQIIPMLVFAALIFLALQLTPQPGTSNPRYTQEDIKVEIMHLPDAPIRAQEIEIYISTTINISLADIYNVTRELHVTYDYPTGGTFENVSLVNERISGDEINGTFVYKIPGQNEGTRITYYVVVAVHLKGGGDPIRKRSDTKTFVVKTLPEYVVLIENWWWVILAAEIGIFGTLAVLFLKATKEEIRY